jgi:mono/diheme cytochrome c family protein
MADLVRGQIAYPEKPMPANLVEGTEADSVALYVAKCSANPNCGVTAASAAPPPATTTGPTTAPSGGGATAEGKKVFTSAGCSGCHTLKDAGATGNVGPNLDTLKPSKAKVAHQVEFGGAVMPAFRGKLTPAQIDAVAAYVSSVAGK